VAATTPPLPAKPIRALLVEDSERDAELLLHELAEGGYDVASLRVETADAMRVALLTQTWDVVLSDYSMPTFSAPDALRVLHETGLDVPFIIVSGTIGEETAVTALKAGASDFLVKGRLARLIPALDRELREAQARRDRAEAQAALEEQLRQAQKMEAIGQLAGGIAHDFNNLLTAILGYCQLLTDQIGPDKAVGRDLREIMTAAQRAAGLTRQLLAFSRRQLLAVTALDLNEAVRSIETMLTRLIGERVTIETTLADDLHAVMADATQLEQVLLNLSVNARDAMPHGGVLSIRTRNAPAAPGVGAVGGDGPGARVELIVADTGVGIPPDLRKKIFEPFFTTKERGHGTGLGLAAVHGIVMQLGGTIEVESRVGEGTEFRVSLPATQAAAVPRRPPTKVQPSSIGTETVLLVEDEPGVRAFIRTALQRFGYRVHEAESAEQALALVEAGRPSIQLLLTDVVLPRMSGRGLAEQLRRSCPGIRVLFMSGYSEEVSTREGFLESGVQLIEKPFTVQALLGRIRQSLAEDV
jgi:signal transduction histidine kinase